MPRKELIYVVEDNNSRDFGKKFVITEPNAFIGEKTLRKMMAVCGGQVSVSTLMGKLLEKEANELWDSLLNFSEIWTGSDINGNRITRKIDKDDIEEIDTIIDIKTKVFDMILGF